LGDRGQVTFIRASRGSVQVGRRSSSKASFSSGDWIVLTEKKVQSPEGKPRRVWVALRAIVGAARDAIARARHVAAFLRSEVGSLVDDNLWKASGDNIYNYNSGNVGIGTASPSVKLEAQSASGSTATGEVARFGYGQNWGGSGATVGIGSSSWDAAQLNGFIYDASSNGTGYLTISTLSSGSQVERLRIDTNGKVGVGTAAPKNHLQVALAPGGNGPTAITSATAYLGLGGPEYAGYRMIGFGYLNGANTGSNYPAYIGYQETLTDQQTKGDLIFLTRDVIHCCPK
jgi:hypothetical protein